MNSILQCLSHTPILRQYFTSRSYLNDINTEAMMGHGGKLAQGFANVINELWNPDRKPRSCMTPKEFKRVLGKLNEMFAGNDQHDAQELLIWLLEGLSEDLNRIMKKPYIDNPDSDGRPDSVLADIWWKNHLKRELSIIVALFTGQFKSTTTCMECGYASARYEPFSTLQLALPEDNLMTVSVVLTLRDPMKCPISCSVRIEKEGSVEDVICEIVKIFTEGLREEDFEGVVGEDGREGEDLEDIVEEGKEGEIGMERLKLVKGKKRKHNSSAENMDAMKGNLEEEEDEEGGHSDGDSDSSASFESPQNGNGTKSECKAPAVTPFRRHLVKLSKNYIASRVEWNRIIDSFKPSDKIIGDKVSRCNNLIYVYEVDKVEETYPKEKEPHTDLVGISMRTLEKHNQPYFLSPFRLQHYGLPILARLPLRLMTGKQIYDYVAERLGR